MTVIPAFCSCAWMSCPIWIWSAVLAVLSAKLKPVAAALAFPTSGLS